MKRSHKELVDKVREINPGYAKYLEKYESNYLAFLKYPEPVRKYIYTTNIVESVNSGLEFMRNKQGFRGRLVGFFNSLKTLEINAFIQFANLHDKFATVYKWLDKPNPVIASLVLQA
ncbi:MAG: transposase [Hydrogenobaculum sp.]